MGELTTQNNTPATGVKGLSSFLNQDNVKAKFAEILGQKANGFIASVLSAVSQNDMLKNADQNSIYLSAMMAASLDLPINSSLGLAYIVPYNQKQKDGSYKQVAQFQLGYRGLKNLAQRSGQFLKMHDTDVKEGEIVKFNRMTGEIDFKWIDDPAERLKKKTIGYLSYFKLQNGFENSLYMTVEEVEAHANKYSQTYKKYKTGLWKDEFDSMARKTVTKLNLSKNAPLSVDLQKAVVADQAVIKNYDPASEDTLDIETEYVDNQDVSLDPQAVAKRKEIERISDYIKKANTLAGLKQCYDAIKQDDIEYGDVLVAYLDKEAELKAKK